MTYNCNTNVVQMAGAGMRDPGSVQAQPWTGKTPREPLDADRADVDSGGLRWRFPTGTARPAILPGGYCIVG
jgi:hypothetical protein